MPNRSGLWARRDVTPFGFGRPYSFGQLESAAAQAPLRARAPRRRALRAAVAPQVLAADRAALGAARPPLRPAAPGRRAARGGLQAGLRPPARRRREGRACPGRSRCSRASPARSPSRSAGAAAAALRRAARPDPAPRGAPAAARIGVLPPCHPSAITAPIFAGTWSASARRSHAVRPRGAGVTSNGRVSVASSASLTSGVAGRYATALFEIAKDAKSLDKVEADVDGARGRPRRERRPPRDDRLAGLHPRGAGQRHRAPSPRKMELGPERRQHARPDGAEPPPLRAAAACSPSSRR